MCIGIFFVIDGVLISDILSVEQCQQYGDYSEHGAHYDYWSNLKPRNTAESIFKAHSYDYFPRGRVILDIKHHQVRLYADRCIDAAMLSNISTTFELPNNIRICHDEHYQCHRCNQMFVDDFDEMDG